MAVRNPRLPLLPGYGANPLLGRKNLGVRPIFTRIDNVNMLLDKSVDESRVPSLYGRQQAPDLPAWILYDKQILRFEGYFQQSLPESSGGSRAVRKVHIYFFLEDGTVKVMEPTTENSGMSQGVLISRQRIRLEGSTDLYLDVMDLNIGFEVTIYGKVFKIVNCDKFTRVFLNRLGISVPDPLAEPHSDQVFQRTSISPKPPKHRPLKQFLDFDRQVLRFYGYWDDRESEWGRLHRLELLYFLADDTVQVRELQGGDVLLKRMRLPRRSPPGVELCGEEPPCVSPADLSVGAALDLYGRTVRLTDCDPFTREYYRVTYGIDTMSPLPTPGEGDRECVDTGVRGRQLPPWNGFGSFEDSAENCRTVEPRPPRRDFIKFLHKDRVGFDSHVLRFAASLESELPGDDRRYFVVQYYLSDDTISVFELGERNSGFKGGKFFRRSKMYCPGASLFSPSEPALYRAPDLWLGACLHLQGHRFRLRDADEYCLRYMELHPDEFPKSNVTLIMDKIRRKLASEENGYKKFVAKYMDMVLPHRKELMAVPCFRQALLDIMCDDLTEHELVTLVRHFREPQADDTPHRDIIRSLVFTSLRRGLWSELVRLAEGVRLADRRGRGSLPPARVRQLLRSHRLPLADQLLDCMLQVLEKNPEGEIVCEELLKFLDFSSPSEVQLAPPVRDAQCVSWLAGADSPRDSLVHWDAFLCELRLDQTSTQLIN